MPELYLIGGLTEGTWGIVFSEQNINVLNQRKPDTLKPTKKRREMWR